MTSPIVITDTEVANALRLVYEKTRIEISWASSIMTSDEKAGVSWVRTSAGFTGVPAT